MVVVLAAVVCLVWLGPLVSHQYWSVGEFTVTLTAYNRVDADNASLTVIVQDIIRSQFCAV